MNSNGLPENCSRSSRVLCVLACALTVAWWPTPAACAGDRLWHRYQEVYEHLQLAKVQAVPEAKRNLVRVVFEVAPKDAGGGPVVFTVSSTSKPARLAVDATGMVEFPVDAGWLSENPEVLVNLPPGQKLSFKMSLVPRLPNRTELGYAELMGGVPQANTLIHEQAGMLAMFVPRMKGVVLRYDHPSNQQVTVGDATAARQYRLNGKGEIEVPYDATVFAANPRVVLTELPQSEDFTD